MLQWCLRLKNKSTVLFFFLLCVDIMELANQSLVKQNSKTTLCLFMFSCFAIWSVVCARKIDNTELVWSLRLPIPVWVWKGFWGREAALLKRQWCVEEASTLPAPNYKMSKWVASLKLGVCLNVSGGVDFELQRGTRNDNSSPLSGSPRSIPHSASVWWRLHLLCRCSAHHQGFP